MSYADLTAEERAALIERQRHGWRSEGVRLHREKDRRRAVERVRALKMASEDLERRINSQKEVA